MKKTKKTRERVNFSFDKDFIKLLNKYCDDNKCYNKSRFIEDIVKDFIEKN